MPWLIIEVDEERTADERRNGAAGGTPKLETKGNNEGKKVIKKYYN